MKKLIRKLAGAVIAFAVIFGMIPTTVFAVEGDHTVILDPNGGVVTGTGTKITDVSISTSGSNVITSQTLGLTDTGKDFFITSDRFATYHMTEFEYVYNGSNLWLDSHTGSSFYNYVDPSFSDMSDYFTGFNPAAGFTTGDAVKITPVTSQTETVTDGGSITSVPTRSGYTFVGWFDEADGGTEVTSVTEDRTVFAHWKKISSSSSSSSESKSSNSEKSDKNPSELPSGTVMSGGSSSCDLKVHSVDAVTTANQTFLANTFAANASSTADIIETKNLDAYRALTTAENGSKQTVTWADIDTKYAGPVYAVVYNPTDKAYMVSGKVDSTGTAKLNNYILRPSSTVTMFKLK